MKFSFFLFSDVVAVKLLGKENPPLLGDKGSVMSTPTSEDRPEGEARSVGKKEHKRKNGNACASLGLAFRHSSSLSNDKFAVAADHDFLPVFPLSFLSHFFDRKERERVSQPKARSVLFLLDLPPFNFSPLRVDGAV